MNDAFLCGIETGFFLSYVQESLRTDFRQLGDDAL